MSLTHEVAARLWYGRSYAELTAHEAYSVDIRVQLVLDPEIWLVGEPDDDMVAWFEDVRDSALEHGADEIVTSNSETSTTGTFVPGNTWTANYHGSQWHWHWWTPADSGKDDA